MTVRNDLNRSHFVQDVIDRLPHLAANRAEFRELVQNKLVEHQRHMDKHGQDMPEIHKWTWR